MAARILIEEPCPNCRQAGLYCELCHGYGVLSRRVLDPGSFVLIEKVDGEWPVWALEAADPFETFDTGEGFKGIRPRGATVILDALAGGG